MRTKPYPDLVFRAWCELLAWDYIAQDDVVQWSRRTRQFVRFLCGIGMSILGLFWWWTEDKRHPCDHSSELVLFSFWRLSINQCTWACSRIRVLWMKHNGIRIELFKV